VARLGGDEFGIVLTDLPDGTAALELAHRVHEALHEPVDIGDMVLDVDGGVGLAVYPDDGSDVEVLMQRADVAMYAAKDAHLGVAAYRAEQDRHSPAKLAMVGDLRRAIDQGELVVYYQPKLSIKTGSVVAAEALVRWEAPGLGLVSPDEFIPVAEQTGLIHPLTEFVMTQSLRDCRGWARLGWDIPVAVNISTRLLYRDGFPEVIRGLLESAGMDPRLLHLEITESMIMDDPDKSYRVLSELRGLGGSDAATGSSSNRQSISGDASDFAWSPKGSRTNGPGTSSPGWAATSPRVTSRPGPFRLMSSSPGSPSLLRSTSTTRPTGPIGPTRSPR